MTKETLTRKQKSAEFGQSYNITVTGRHVHVTDAMKSYAYDKISKLERIADRIIDVTVTMDIQKLNHRVDIVMKYGHTLIVSHASSTDMYVSIDQAIEKLQKQLKKYKRRLHDHHAKGYPVVEVPVTVYSPSSDHVAIDAVDEVEVNHAIDKQTRHELESSLRPHKIVSVEMQSLKILTDDEAIMKMELSQSPLMVFRAEKSNKLRVIYRRDDGNYGIVQPE